MNGFAAHVISRTSGISMGTHVWWNPTRKTVNRTMRKVGHPVIGRFWSFFFCASHPSSERVYSDWAKKQIHTSPKIVLIRSWILPGKKRIEETHFWPAHTAQKSFCVSVIVGWFSFLPFKHSIQCLLASLSGALKGLQEERIEGFKGRH